ncbi:MAG: hypothetical protein IKN90_07315 [Treponema sp.]|jgi:hypothetical protein|nr:hypothetical protein [Treponema sp.]HAM78589.1 hypothetical protein [Treponema sp.]
MKDTAPENQVKMPLKYHIGLVIGIGILLCGVFLLAFKFSSGEDSFGWKSIFLTASGAFLLYISITLIKKAIWVFLGIAFFLFGVQLLLLDAKILPFTFIETWPLTIIICGLAMIPSGLYNLKRIRTIYLFPAILMILMGTFFLLFSMHIFKSSFRHFIFMWWPIILIFGGIWLIILFVVQQKHHEILPYMNDDSLIEGEESNES